MYLVLDNAAYHKPRDETWISSSKAQNKHELAHQLLDLGVTQLTTVDDRRRIISSHLFGATIGEGGPSKEDLIRAVEDWLDEHPDHNRTVVEQLMSDAGHSLIYTPPFCPDVQPIELLWAEIKREVASQSTLNRSMTETREQTEDAFEKITHIFCNSIIKHCHDWMDNFIQSDDGGDLKQCGSLAGVMKSLPLLKLATTEQPKHDPSSVNVATMDISPPPPASAPPTRTLRKRH